MRKIAPVLAGLGAFLLVTGLLLKLVAPNYLERTPTDTDSKTYLTGQASKLNPKTGKVDDFDVKVLSITRGNANKSDGDVVVFANSSCVVIDRNNVPDCVTADDPDNRLVNASVDNFATDRRSAMSVNKSKYLPADAEPHEGLVNKWPFDAKKKNYDYWDGLLGEAQTAEYTRTEKLDGLETYLYTVTVPETDAEIAKDTEGTYESTKQIWIDPKTGAIIKQTQDETRKLDGDVVFSIDAEFTPEQVAKNVKDAKANGDKLSLVTGTLPVVLIVLGVLLLIAGLALALLRGRRDETA